MRAACELLSTFVIPAPAPKGRVYAVIVCGPDGYTCRPCPLQTALQGAQSLIQAIELSFQLSRTLLPNHQADVQDALFDRDYTLG